MKSVTIVWLAFAPSFHTYLTAINLACLHTYMVRCYPDLVKLHVLAEAEDGFSILKRGSRLNLEEIETQFMWRERLDMVQPSLWARYDTRTWHWARVHTA
jgi:hypothetical protein